MSSFPDGEMIECDDCLGTGRDSREPDGLCHRCFGKGEYFVRYPDEDEDCEVDQ